MKTINSKLIVEEDTRGNFRTITKSSDEYSQLRNMIRELASGKGDYSREIPNGSNKVVTLECVG